MASKMKTEFENCGEHIEPDECPQCVEARFVPRPVIVEITRKPDGRVHMGLRRQDDPHWLVKIAENTGRSFEQDRALLYQIAGLLNLQDELDCDLEDLVDSACAVAFADPDEMNEELEDLRMLLVSYDE